MNVHVDLYLAEVIFLLRAWAYTLPKEVVATLAQHVLCFESSFPLVQYVIMERVTSALEGFYLRKFDK